MKLIKSQDDVDLAKKRLDSLIFKTKGGKAITYRYELVKNIKRTLSQNSYYWWCLKLFGRDCGHTKDELHEIFKIMFLKEFSEYEKDFYKKIEVFGIVKYSEISSTNLNTSVFTKYIEFIRNFASSEGCYIPEANEIPDSERY